MDKNGIFRQIPKIDRVMQQPEIKLLIQQYGYDMIRDMVREEEEKLRKKFTCEIAENDSDGTACPAGANDFDMCHLENINIQETFHDSCMAYLLKQVEKSLKSSRQKRMQRVINATGVILHTNLGRAPLGEKLVKELVPLMTGYTNLELNLEDGKRGSRYAHFSENLCRLTGAEAVLAVNNNAAAVLVMLTALASGKETVVSRGELVEIGGKFRIPDVCSQSGTTLVEVGTTNRTYLEDYENAVGEYTAAFLKVHTSNYQITGFTHEASVEELAKAAHSHHIPLLVDLGSGCLMDAIDMESYGLRTELTVKDLLRKGADLVSFSGDKLLGGPQAGILAGRKDLIDQISSHPLMRAIRIDKFTAAALDKTVEIYLKNEKKEDEIPVYKMLERTTEELKNMAEELLQELSNMRACDSEAFEAEVIRTQSFTGGGTAPGNVLPGVALRMRTKKVSAKEISQRFRSLEIPVIGRIEDDWFYLEMRTLLPGEMELVKEAVSTVLESVKKDKSVT